jgi:hypothetical protein
VAGSPQLVGESEESRGLSLCVVKQQYLGHGRESKSRPDLADQAATTVARAWGIVTLESRMRAFFGGRLEPTGWEVGSRVHARVFPEDGRR